LELQAVSFSPLVSVPHSHARRSTVRENLVPRLPLFLFTSLQVGHSYVCEHHRAILHSMRAKRKRKDSEEENDYQTEVIDAI